MEPVAVRRAVNSLRLDIDVNDRHGTLCSDLSDPAEVKRLEKLVEQIGALIKRADSTDNGVSGN